MKNIFIILWFFSLLQCTTQKQREYVINTNPIKDTLMFEKFDFELNKTGYAGYERVHNSGEIYGSNEFYKLKDGGAFSPEKDKEGAYYFVIPPSPHFYSMNYIYYPNGNLKMKGRLAGFHGEIPVGKWQEYDEIGRVKEVDEERKFGLWPFEKVLEKLDKDEVINLETGKNREANRLKFYFTKENKEWTVKVFKKDKNEFVEEYWEYLFDGNTGKHSREWYEEYNDDIKGQIGEGMPMPPLKNSKKNKQKRLTDIYKTHEGKDYTQAEWKVFEQEQYNEHLRKTGRADLVKPVEKVDTPKTESTRKSLFLADEEDVKPQKKKGFWDNFLA